MRCTEYLADLLASASIDAPSSDCVDLEKMILAREVETAIFQHPPSSIAFPAVKIGHSAKLIFAIGIKEVARLRLKSPVRFIISIESDGRRKVLFKATLNPRKLGSDRAWQRNELDLSKFAGQSIRLVFTTRVGWRRSTEYAWAGWANPRIVHEVAVTAQLRRRDRHPHIFLLTADALPARYLGCYGDPEVQTPALDRLAADGVLFEQAWSQSCMTLGSYVSLLTGLYPHEHGVSREWQTFPVAKMNLATALKQHGYHTTFAVSSRELSGRTNYLDRVFDEVLHTLSNPMQDGAVTNRLFRRWFEARPDRSCFSWIHYFDVHPPSAPPAPFDSMYYSGNPTDHQNEYLASDVKRIHSVESALIMKAALPVLERGRPVAEVIDILEDTAAVLTTGSKLRPDLAEHVLNLGRSAMRDRSPDEFGKWLKDQIRQMRAGRVSPELVQWIKDVNKLLEPTERDIMSWLEDVVDFRYPVSVYKSTVSYFDSQIDSLLSYLREQDLYDQSLIVVTAPHGEILQDAKLPYQHFLLRPDTLHVPLIMKLPAKLETQRGVRLRGVFDLIDLFPTIMDAQGLPRSFELSGVSRWNQIKSGKDIPPHDSFAAGLHQLSHSICRPPYLFIQKQPGVGMNTFYDVVNGADEMLCDSNAGDVYGDLPNVSESLRQALDEWRASAGLNAP